MAISPDVVATALNELMPAYSNLFIKWHPLLEKIMEGGNMDRAALKGPKREFAVVTDGPGTVTEIATGTEVIAGGRSQNAHRGNVIAPRLIYAFDVPGKDLAEANGCPDQHGSRFGQGIRGRLAQPVRGHHLVRSEWSLADA